MTEPTVDGRTREEQVVAGAAERKAKLIETLEDMLSGVRRGDVIVTELRGENWPHYVGEGSHPDGRTWVEFRYRRTERVKYDTTGRRQWAAEPERPKRPSARRGQ